MNTEDGATQVVRAKTGVLRDGRVLIAQLEHSALNRRLRCQTSRKSPSSFAIR